MKEINYRTVRRRVILRLLNRILFFAHAFVFLANAIAPYPNGIVVLWLPIVVAHFAWAFNFNPVGRLLDRQTEREIERLRARGYVVNPPEHMPARIAREKAKRAARLTDDGEIEYAEDDDAEYGDAPAPRSRTYERD